MKQWEKARCPGPLSPAGPAEPKHGEGRSSNRANASDGAHKSYLLHAAAQSLMVFLST